MTYQNNPNGEIVTVVEPDTTPAPNPLRWLWWLLGLLVLAALIWALTRACRTTEEPAAPAGTPVAPIATVTPIATVNLHCGNDQVEARVFSDQVEATIGGEHFVLPNAESASGARYYADGLTLWEHQGEWMLIHNEGAANEERIDCTTN